ncbi:DUF397 domain-containing protein [Streptomyces sp. NPDC003077]|uniref:DUF397 domain-containing protein n=1 Tax=Streptomyces sp. NPDC003077 TaxID=3154443 RepID=UPI0033ABA82D
MRMTLDLSAVTWRSSSYSNQEGGACVEIADPSAVAWRKSTYSNNDGGMCIEIADGVPALVPVRDSKNPTGPVLTFSPAAFGAFVAAVRSGEL